MKRFIIPFLMVCLTCAIKAQIHTGVYTHGSIGRNKTTGQTITVDKQLLNVEFYSDYIKVNGNIAKFVQEAELPLTTPSIGIVV